MELDFPHAAKSCHSQRYLYYAATLFLDLFRALNQMGKRILLLKKMFHCSTIFVMFSRLNHPIVPALVTAVCYFIFLLLFLNRHDPGSLPQVGGYFTDATLVPKNIVIVTESTGYDGQFYYRLAINPFTDQQFEFGMRLDNPRYRHQRILYPLLGWLFSFGTPSLVIYSLILVNFTALIVIGFSAGKYAQLVGKNALSGLAFSLYPGFLYTLSRDLVEITEATFILLALVAIVQKHKVMGSTLLSLAILAKETALLSAITFIAQKKYRVIALLPLGTYGIWQLFLNWWWGYGLAESTPKNIGTPILGIVEGYLLGYEGERWIVATAFLGLFFILVIVSLPRSTADKFIKISCLFYTLLLLSLTQNVWIESLAFGRAASLFYLFGTAVLLRSRKWILASSFALTVISWVWLASDLLAA